MQPLWPEVLFYQMLILSEALQALLYDLMYERQKEGEKGEREQAQGWKETFSNLQGSFQSHKNHISGYC